MSENDGSSSRRSSMGLGGRVARIFSAGNTGKQRDFAASKEWFNPEADIELKRDWTARQAASASQSSVTNVEDVADLASSGRMFEYFCIVGLPPDTNITRVSADNRTYHSARLSMETGVSSITPDATQENSARKYGPRGPSLRAQVLFSYPEPLPEHLADSIASFCHPHGVRPELVERTPSLSAYNEVVFNQRYQNQSDHSFVFLMQSSSPGRPDPRPLYGVCCLTQELVHRPPALARERYPTPNRPTPKYSVMAPRCYCLLSTYPFFSVHFAVLHTVLGLERLERISTLAEDQETAPPTETSSRPPPRRDGFGAVGEEDGNETSNVGSVEAEKKYAMDGEETPSSVSFATPVLEGRDQVSSSSSSSSSETATAAARGRLGLDTASGEIAEVGINGNDAVEDERTLLDTIERKIRLGYRRVRTLGAGDEGVGLLAPTPASTSSYCSLSDTADAHSSPTREGISPDLGTPYFTPATFIASSKAPRRSKGRSSSEMLAGPATALMRHEEEEDAGGPVGVPRRDQATSHDVLHERNGARMDLEDVRSIVKRDEREDALDSNFDERLEGIRRILDDSLHQVNDCLAHSSPESGSDRRRFDERFLDVRIHRMDSSSDTSTEADPNASPSRMSGRVTEEAAHSAPVDTSKPDREGCCNGQISRGDDGDASSTQVLQRLAVSSEDDGAEMISEELKKLHMKDASNVGGFDAAEGIFNRTVDEERHEDRGGGRDDGRPDAVRTCAAEPQVPCDRGEVSMGIVESRSGSDETRRSGLKDDSSTRIDEEEDESEADVTGRDQQALLLDAYLHAAVPRPGQIFHFRPDPWIRSLSFHRLEVVDILHQMGVRVDDPGIRHVEAVQNLNTWAIAALCRSLSLDSLLTFVAAALLEQQIVVFCPNIGILTAMVLSIIPMIFPFSWQSLLLPVLPAIASDHLDLLEAPVPFIVGVVFKTSEVRSRCNSIVRVNAYKNKVRNAGNLPSLPQSAALSEALSGPYEVLRKAGEVPGADARPIHAVTESQAAAATAFAATLQTYLKSLVADLKGYTITDVSASEGSERVSILLKESFIESFPPRDRIFMRQFVETQMFNVYCDSVI